MFMPLKYQWYYYKISISNLAFLIQVVSMYVAGKERNYLKSKKTVDVSVKAELKGLILIIS